MTLKLHNGSHCLFRQIGDPTSKALIVIRVTVKGKLFPKPFRLVKSHVTEAWGGATALEAKDSSESVGEGRLSKPALRKISLQEKFNSTSVLKSLLREQSSQLRDSLVPKPLNGTQRCDQGRDCRILAEGESEQM